MSEKHQKHVKLAKPFEGEFHRNEWGVTGAPCEVIRDFCGKLAKQLSKSLQTGYVDMSHREDAEAASSMTADFVFTDKISFREIQSHSSYDPWTLRSQCSFLDIVFINGNHFKAERNLVILDSRKEDSLRRKITDIKDVEAFILGDSPEVFPFIKEQVPGWESIPVFEINETVRIAGFLEEKIQQNIPQLNGLVLAGGWSKRMGKDKGDIPYHGIPQRDYLAGLAGNFSKEVFISCREDQAEKLKNSGFPMIRDTFTDLGPFGALLSAFRQQPDVAWMVLACDLPFLDEMTLKFLIENRNPAKLATAFQNEETHFPEPLITIWEPRAYPRLLTFLSQGNSCPRKVLINSDIELLQPPDKKALLNVNTPEEMEAALRSIEKILQP